MWICPLCNDRLTKSEKTWRCSSNHCFDEAKEGYLNLLPVQNKRSLSPGDSPEMIRQRREFLELGFYQPFVNVINELIDEYRPADKLSKGVDIGCGEGYYTHQFCKDGTSWQGIDISKAAVKTAAKKYRSCNFAVASNAAIPIADGSLDVVTAVFAPFAIEEVSRLLKPGGLFIIAGPGPGHLDTLKRTIYTQSRASEPVSINHQSMAFDKEVFVESNFTLSNSADIAALIAMTPLQHHGDREKKQRLIDSGELQTQAQFHIRLFIKKC